MIRDLTPESMRCGGSNSSCPAVFELDDGRLLIVGRRADPHDVEQIPVGGYEYAVTIDRALLANVDPFPSNPKAHDNPYEPIVPYDKPDVWDVR